MKKVRIKMACTIAAQFMVNSEVEGLMHDGTFYVPLIPGIGGAEAEEVDEPTPTKKSAVKTVAKPTATASSKKFTETELQEKSQKELEALITKLGGDVPDDDTKNTNKRLRTIVLELQAGVEEVGEEEEEEEEEEEKPAKRGEKKQPAKDGKNVAKEVSDILKRLDEGDLEEEADAVAELAKLGGDKKSIAKIVATFMKSPKEPVTTFEKQLVSEIEGGENEEEEEEETPKGKKSGGKKTMLQPDEFDTLEVGTKVGVYWKDQEGFFDGKVEKVDRKGILIAYDDGTKEYIDDENNTEIELL